TTTTSLTGAVLTEGSLDPTLIIGGKVRSLNTNAQLGESDFLVAEVDEFDRSLLTVIPTIAVITNIESDHLECYDNLDDLKNSFLTFANKVPFYGKVIVCLDNMGIQEVLNKIKRKVETYGFSSQADVTARNVEYGMNGVSFDTHYHDTFLGRIQLQIPGNHNVLNALASIAVGLELNVPFPKIQKGLQNFSGVNRRFEIKAVIGDIMVVDDYAHHPTEIMATLQGARTGWPGRRIVAVFQPHLYSRTQNFYKEFARSFFDADVLFVTEIYPAREEPIEGVTGNLIAQTAIELGHKNVRYIDLKDQVADEVAKILNPKDMLITIGAGDVWRINDHLLKELNEIYGQG
ncbi:MAG: UDP-N-acetylmuramate--L-alanine ligase, partial [Aliifodinibius sp.]|nr:UDP-N-acetylmuramate--L-alanine ligase [Fodinibius sp.]NIV15873.1 UDP-N-acetylmuramate--L-alanine ligase [Fodinibius sp.]NIY29815.1 UDP-N-acetylmuramate--L-alanine ligase [Fodinibius sp.]